MIETHLEAVVPFCWSNSAVAFVWLSYVLIFVRSDIIICSALKVGLLDEEKILPLGKDISAVGVCYSKNGIPEIKSCKDLPYFL